MLHTLCNFALLLCCTHCVILLCCFAIHLEVCPSSRIQWLTDWVLFIFWWTSLLWPQAPCLCNSCPDQFDILLFFNLALIAGCVLFSNEFIRQRDNPSDSSEYHFKVYLFKSIQLVFLYLPMLAVLFLFSRCIFAALKLKCCKAEPSSIQADDDTLEYRYLHDTVKNVNSHPCSGKGTRSSYYGSIGNK